MWLRNDVDGHFICVPANIQCWLFDELSRLDTVHKCDRQMDGQRSVQRTCITRASFDKLRQTLYIAVCVCVFVGDRTDNGCEYFRGPGVQSSSSRQQAILPLFVAWRRRRALLVRRGHVRLLISHPPSSVSLATACIYVRCMQYRHGKMARRSHNFFWCRLIPCDHNFEIYSLLLRHAFAIAAYLKLERLI